MDDTIFSAADFATGRTASVSRTGALDLLLASGDLLPGDLPAPTELRELGKPERVAALLARRRDGDPMGSGGGAPTAQGGSRTPSCLAVVRAERDAIDLAAEQRRRESFAHADVVRQHGRKLTLDQNALEASASIARAIRFCSVG